MDRERCPAFIVPRIPEVVVKREDVSPRVSKSHIHQILQWRSFSVVRLRRIHWIGTEDSDGTEGGSETGIGTVRERRQVVLPFVVLVSLFYKEETRAFRIKTHPTEVHLVVQPIEVLSAKDKFLLNGLRSPQIPQRLLSFIRRHRVDEVVTVTAPKPSQRIVSPHVVDDEHPFADCFDSESVSGRHEDEVIEESEMIRKHQRPAVG